MRVKMNLPYSFTTPNSCNYCSFTRKYVQKALSIRVTLKKRVYKKVDVNIVLINKSKSSTNLSHQNNFADMTVTHWRSGIKIDR